jgi:deoxyadenosine/deoxycytidine kinase
MILWLSGPTGSGKSSYAEILAQFGYRIVHEILPASLFEAFSKDPLKYCEALQEAIMRSRLEQWTALAGSQNVAFDRSVDEDGAVFCRMHHERGILSDEAFDRMQALARVFQTAMPAPELIIYMSPGRDALHERVTRGGHPQTIVDGLDRQIALYTEWLSGQKQDVVAIDNSGCGFETVQRLFGVSA